MLKRTAVISIFLFAAASVLAAPAKQQSTTPVSVGSGTGTLVDAPYQVCFTPGGHCLQLIINAIDQAQQSIDIQAYSFDSKVLLNALIGAHKRGVKIMVLMDKSNVNNHQSYMQALEKNHIPFLIDYKPAIAHSKVIIIDGQTVLTGSFYDTRADQKKNAENLLMITDKSLAAHYLKNFTYRQSQSESLSQYCMTSTMCKLNSITKSIANDTAKGAKNLWQGTKDFWKKNF